MGLDQFAYRIEKGTIEADVDFSTEEYNEETSARFQGGFFFGSDRSTGEDEKEDDLEFVSKAIIAVTDGHEIYYSSWW